MQLTQGGQFPFCFSPKKLLKIKQHAERIQVGDSFPLGPDVNLVLRAVVPKCGPQPAESTLLDKLQKGEFLFEPLMLELLNQRL